MHVVEHIGLGRYGDAIDYDDDLKAMRELKRMVALKGQLLFVVPMGRVRIQFNAHRICDFDQIAKAFSGCQIENFSLITDRGSFVESATKEMADRETYGCGCFWFVKDEVKL